MKKSRSPRSIDVPHSPDLASALFAKILASDLDAITSITAQGSFFNPLNSGLFLRFAAANTEVAPEVIDALLDTGRCPINSPDADGITPLMFAAAKNNTAAAQKLLARGADVTIQDNQGRTALMLCFHPETPDPELIRALLTQANGANILVLPSPEEPKKSAFDRACKLALSNHQYVDILNEMAASAARDGLGTQAVRMTFFYRKNFGETLSDTRVQELLSSETLRIVGDMPLAIEHLQSLKTGIDLRNLTETFTSSTNIPSSSAQRPFSPTAEGKKRKSLEADLS